MGEWAKNVSGNPHHFKASFKRFLTEPATTEAYFALKNGFPSTVAGPSLELPCVHCQAAGIDRTFRNKQLLAIHSYKHHGIKHYIRRYVTITQCSACLLEFHTRERLIAYLRDKAPNFRLYYFCAIDPMEPHEAEALDQEEAPKTTARVHAGFSTKHTGHVKVYRLPGPLPMQLDRPNRGRNFYYY